MVYINYIFGEWFNFLFSVLKINKDMYFIIDVIDLIDDSGNFFFEVVLCYIFNYIYLRFDIEYKCIYINNESMLRIEINDINLVYVKICYLM